MQLHVCKVVDKTACLNVRKVVLRPVLVDAVEVVVATAREIAQELAEEDAVMVVLEVVQEVICLLVIKRNGINKR